MFDWPWPESVLNAPAHISPNGTYNFDIHPPYNNEAYALIAICVTLTLLGVVVRAFSRLCVTKEAYLEDYLALFALIPYFMFIWSIIMYIRGGGLFVHQWNIRIRSMLDLGVYIFVFCICDPIYAIFAKSAILLEWKRIFVPHGIRNRFYWASWFLIWFNFLAYFIGTLFWLFANRPVAKSWDILLSGSSLFNRKAIDEVASGINVFVDISTFLLPQPVIWSLKLTRERKVGISLMFSLGLLSVGTAAGRLYATVKTEYPWPTIGDTSYTVSYTWLWFLAELTTVNLVLAAPSLPRVFSSLSRWIQTKVLFWASILPSRSHTTISKPWSRTFGSAPSDCLRDPGNEFGLPINLTDLGAMQGLHGNRWTVSQLNTVLRTIELYQREETVSSISLDRVHQRQNLWMDIV